MGLLISFEGTDGCGKSTQIKMLAEYLEKKKYDVLVSREPGGCRIGENIREILLNADNTELSPLCELFLYEAARAQHMAETVLPALDEGKIVILDRFIDSTYAYQGFGRQLGEENVRLLNNIAVSGRLPDITLMLELPPQEAFKRKGGNDVSDRMEMAGDDFFERVRDGFNSAVKAFPERIKVIQVEGTREETHTKICECIDKILEVGNG